MEVGSLPKKIRIPVSPPKIRLKINGGSRKKKIKKI
jgi:hypothetical protein